MRNAIVLALYLSMFYLLSPAFSAGGGDITFTSKNADPVHFSHDFHLKLRGLKCMACHFQKFAKGGASFEMKKEELTKRTFCEHCHNGMKAFDVSNEKNCIRCHSK
jgi:c(7)-type cytochrome triheme protein